MNLAHTLGITVTLGIGGALLSLLASYLVVNTTPSAPMGVYWYKPLTRETAPERGQMVIIDPPAYARQHLRGLAPQRADWPWMKTVVATGGDTFCLETPPSCTTVAAGTYFVMNAHLKSFDSRAYGALERQYIRGTVTPLWTRKAHQ